MTFLTILVIMTKDYMEQTWLDFKDPVLFRCITLRQQVE